MTTSEIFTTAPTTPYAEAHHLPFVQELVRRATAFCNTIGHKFSTDDIVVVKTLRGRAAILLNTIERKQNGRMRRRGAGGRWQPKMIWVKNPVVYVELRELQVSAAGEFTRKERLVIVFPDLVVEE